MTVLYLTCFLCKYYQMGKLHIECGQCMLHDEGALADDRACTNFILKEETNETLFSSSS